MLTLLLLAAMSQPSDGCFKTPGVTTPAPAAACTMCAQNLIMKTTIGAGSHAFQSDVTMVVNGCDVRTLTCVGTMANIELNNGDGVIMDGDDGNVDGTATLTVTCNAAGTGWVFMGVVITQAECASS